MQIKMRNIFLAYEMLVTRVTEKNIGNFYWESCSTLSKGQTRVVWCLSWILRDSLVDDWMAGWVQIFVRWGFKYKWTFGIFENTFVLFLKYFS
jgi:hypothetical protein